MGLFDVIFLIIIGGFTLFGFWFGFVHTLGSLMGTILGAYLASRYYQPAAEWLMNITGWEANIARVTMFVVAFFIINRLVGVVFYLIDKVSRVITKLPIIKSINRFLGLILGFVEGVISIGLVVYFIERFPLSESIMQSIAESKVAPFTLKVASYLVPLLPEALQVLDSTVDFVENTVL